MRPSDERIKLMDNLLNAYIESKNYRLDKPTLMKNYQVDRNEIKAAGKNVLQFLHDQRWLNAEFFQDGSGEIASWLDKSEATNFRDSGGFCEYYSLQQDKKTSSNTNNVTITGGTAVIIQDSTLDQARINPTIQNKTNNTTHNPPKRSVLEILAWIIGIIAGLVAIYEFIINKK